MTAVLNEDSDSIHAQVMAGFHQPAAWEELVCVHETLAGSSSPGFLVSQVLEQVLKGRASFTLPLRVAKAMM